MMQWKTRSLPPSSRHHHYWLWLVLENRENEHNAKACSSGVLVVVTEMVEETVISIPSWSYGNELLCLSLFLFSFSIFTLSLSFSPSLTQATLSNFILYLCNRRSTLLAWLGILCCCWCLTYVCFTWFGEIYPENPFMKSQLSCSPNLTISLNIFKETWIQLIIHYLTEMHALYMYVFIWRYIFVCIPSTHIITYLSKKRENYEWGADISRLVQYFNLIVW